MAAVQAEADGGGVADSGSVEMSGRRRALVLRVLGLTCVSLAFVFTFNNWLIHWRGWPGLPKLYSHLEIFGQGPLRTPLSGGELAQAAGQAGLYLVTILLVLAWVLKDKNRLLVADADRLSQFAAYIVRGAFFAVFFVGLTDATISFLRVEGLLADVVGEGLAKDLGRSSYRGEVVHYPLIALSYILALFTRTLGFHWLALFIVVAELQIVLARFIFSYEQAFMADLVRFWYGAMFLFASGYTLLVEGHVRVDILYASFTERSKAWANLIGAIVLGVPLCWIILTRGMWGKTNMINGPMLNYEVTQSGFGMFVKYFMAAFLVVYATSMLLQFVSYALRSAAVLLGETKPNVHSDKTQPEAS